MTAAEDWSDLTSEEIDELLDAENRADEEIQPLWRLQSDLGLALIGLRGSCDLAQQAVKRELRGALTREALTEVWADVDRLHAAADRLAAQRQLRLLPRDLHDRPGQLFDGDGEQDESLPGPTCRGVDHPAVLLESPLGLRRAVRCFAGAVLRLRLRHDSSSAVGAPGAEDTESLAATVEAPADSPSSSAGRGAGGTRPRRLLPRLRGRPSP